MNGSFRLPLVAAALLASGSIAACHAATRQPAAAGVQPAANGTAPHSSANPAATATAATHPRYNEADVRFMQGMIGHHQGALTMVKQLFGTPGATQEAQIFEFATDVDAGQRAEISRMRALLDEMPDRPPQR